MNVADLRAEAAAAWDQTITPETVSADTHTARPGWTVWRSGTAFCHLPTLRPDAPPDALARYWLRVVAGLSGHCAACDQTADITYHPGTAAFWVLPVAIHIPHPPTCPALFADSEADLFDPEAFR